MLSYDTFKSLKNCTQQMLLTIGFKLWSSEGSLSVTWAFISDANFQMGGENKICVFISTADGSVALNAKGKNLWLAKLVWSLVTLLTDFSQNETSFAPKEIGCS